VNGVLPILVKYLELQRADLALRAAVQQGAAFPARRAELAQRLAAARVPVKQQQEKIQAAEKQSRAIDRDLADLADKKKKEQGRTFSVKTQVELNALEREVAELARQIGAVEEQGVALLEELEAMRAALPALTAALQAAERDVAAAQAELAAAEAAVRGEQERLTGERAAAAAKLDEDERAEYDRIAAHRDGVVVAELDPVKFSCSGCVIRVRPQLVEEIYNGQLVHCEGCQRLLMAAPGAVDSEPA